LVQAACTARRPLGRQRRAEPCCRSGTAAISRDVRAYRRHRSRLAACRRLRLLGAPGFCLRIRAVVSTAATLWRHRRERVSLSDATTRRSVRLVATRRAGRTARSSRYPPCGARHLPGDTAGQPLRDQAIRRRDPGAPFELHPPNATALIELNE